MGESWADDWNSAAVGWEADTDGADVFQEIPQIEGYDDQITFADIRPQYSKSIDVAIGQPSPSLSILPIRPPPPPRNCWNCGDTDHTRANCPLPYDAEVIQLNRTIWRAAKKERDESFEDADSWTMVSYAGRVQDEFLSRKMRLANIDQFCPGKLSESLRAALREGTKGEDGSSIWEKMSVWGYPPAYLSVEGKHRQL